MPVGVDAASLGRDRDLGDDRRSLGRRLARDRRRSANARPAAVPPRPGRVRPRARGRSP